LQKGELQENVYEIQKEQQDGQEQVKLYRQDIESSEENLP